MRVFLYVMSAWRDPDSCERSVPYEIDDAQIFFGPCKRKLRAMLRAEYLGDEQRREVDEEDLFLVGLNGANPQRQRKIIWAGRITSLMTFAYAWQTLTGERYEEMRNDPFSPLHLEPLFHGGKHVGYRHANPYHQGQWVRDLTAKRESLDETCEVTDDEIRVRRGHTPGELFERDACVLLERRFVADGSGIEFSDAMLGLLRDAGILRSGDSLDAYAVFGHRENGSADGRTGRWIEISGATAEQFMGHVATRVTARSSPLRIASARLCDCGGE
jgi:hypothetical protein